MSLRPLRFITLPISHYCEKVRWVLDRQQVPYVEEGHAPLFHAFHSLPLTGGASRTLPILIDDNQSPRQVLADSADCLRHLADQHGATWLYPSPDAAAIEAELGDKLGPATRRFAYFHLLPRADLTLPLLTARVPGGEVMVARLLYPVIRRVMARSMRIDAAGAERSRQVLRAELAKWSARLSDGRKYLCGDALSAADVTLGALGAPMVWPDGYAQVPMPKLSALPAALGQEIEQARQTLAGQLILRLYAEDRRPSRPPAAP
ncbi:MAG: glutathione S-transferase family protein [Myxococcales bacterium]|nr:glutathione S-transferase family protein [Myxococcales bacterium]